mmetsp:Transcript_102018/g.288023  ORF Transcript_102018/g.288023 Transcript_102018/m.288023 type:complete len:239 (+) Transcript_102018:232-948(+)
MRASTRVKGKPLAQGLEAWRRAQQRQLHRDLSAESGAQAAGTNREEAEAVAGDKAMPRLLDLIAQLLLHGAQSAESFLQVKLWRQRDEAEMVLLVHPAGELRISGYVDSPGLRPLAAQTGRQDQGGVGLLEEEALPLKPRRIRRAHASRTRGVGLGAVQRQVLSGALALDPLERGHEHRLDFSALLLTAHWRHLEADEVSLGANTHGENIPPARIQWVIAHLRAVQVHAVRQSLRRRS